MTFPLETNVKLTASCPNIEAHLGYGGHFSLPFKTALHSCILTVVKFLHVDRERGRVSIRLSTSDHRVKGWSPTEILSEYE